MSPGALDMALTTPSPHHNNSDTDSMARSRNGPSFVARIRQRLKGRDPHALDTGNLNNKNNNNGNATLSMNVIKPGMQRMDSEIRENLVPSPMTPQGKRFLRSVSPRTTAVSLGPPDPSASQRDLSGGWSASASTEVDRRRSYVDPQNIGTEKSPPASPYGQTLSPHMSPSPGQYQGQQYQSQHQQQQSTPPPSQQQQQQQQRQQQNQSSQHSLGQTTAGSTHDNHSSDSRTQLGGGGGAPAWDAHKPVEPTWQWVLNLSMHFKDHSHREKFFVTYAPDPKCRRRVTVSCDYRHAEPGSLEAELSRLKSQQEKSLKIYESIREALPDIKFYDTTTNLKIQTEHGRLNVHVTEDIHEIIHYPPIKSIAHLDCPKVRESDLVFDSHLSGFVYKVFHEGQVYIKKEIPSPDTVDEFLYEINALYALQGSSNVIRFGGCVVDGRSETVRGLLIAYADKGALIDILYNEKGNLSWNEKENWARQIISGLADIHEAGYVQGDFTLSNIVVDKDNNAQIIDINRRGCPVHWEPPEITVMIPGLQRIGIYIGVKSDIFQLGMCLWGIAMENDEPETVHRPLSMSQAPAEVPGWFREIVESCLNKKPQDRPSAKELRQRFRDFSTPATPLSPRIIEVAPTFDGVSNPPSPTIPQSQIECMMLLPDQNGRVDLTAAAEASRAIAAAVGNGGGRSTGNGGLGDDNYFDSEDNFERFEAVIEAQTSLEDEVVGPLDEVVEDTYAKENEKNGGEDKEKGKEKDKDKGKDKGKAEMSPLPPSQAFPTTPPPAKKKKQKNPRASKSNGIQTHGQSSSPSSSPSQITSTSSNPSPLPGMSSVMRGGAGGLGIDIPGRGLNGKGHGADLRLSSPPPSGPLPPTPGGSPGTSPGKGGGGGGNMGQAGPRHVDSGFAEGNVGGSGENGGNGNWRTWGGKKGN